MKASSIKRLTVALFILLALIFGGQVLRFTRYLSNDIFYGWDARLRRNEICCAHQGVNSFRIWNRETALLGFTPLPRGDKADVPHAADDAMVHAYPPWHTSMFYWYGWLSERAHRVLLTLFFWACLCFIVWECVKLAKARFENYWFVVGLSFASIAYYIDKCFIVLNYGVFILALFFLMNRALEKNHNILAGLAWAVMMIKPQVGLLFVWPLFWKRHYLTIVTAVVICLVETVVTSFLVHESVIDLILQVPQIGGPYPKGLIAGCLKPILGSAAPIVVMATFFILTGLATWGLRKYRDFLVCCIPVMLAIPVWTYSQPHDCVILLPALIILLGNIFEMQKSSKWTPIRIFYCAAAICIAVWTLVVELNLVLHLFNLLNLRWEKIPFVIARIGLWVVSVLVFLVLLFRKEFEPKREGGSAAEI